MSGDGHTKPRILIVEDEPFIALTLEDMLDELGFELVGTVSQVTEALEMAGREQVDCALLDVNLGSREDRPRRRPPVAARLPFHLHHRLRPVGHPGGARRTARCCRSRSAWTICPTC